MVATRRSQKAAEQKLSAPKRTFADLPDEIIVDIALWLPQKDHKRPGLPRRHLPPDLASFSLTDKRIRALLAERILFNESKLTLATYEHLKELSEHREWLHGARNIRLPIHTAYNSGRHPGRTAQEYDAMLASVIGKIERLNSVTFSVAPSADIDESDYPESYLTCSLRAVAKHEEIHAVVLNLHNSVQEYEFGLAAAFIQAWPEPEKLTGLGLSITDDLDAPLYIRLVKIIESFPKLERCVVWTNKIAAGAMQHLPQSFSCHRQTALRFLHLSATCAASADAIAIQIITGILRACPLLRKLDINFSDFLWVHESKSGPHGICLPLLQHLCLTSTARPMSGFNDGIIDRLDRSDTVLATSPIMELEMDSLQAARLVCGMMTFARAKLPNLKQLLLSSDLARTLKSAADSAARDIHSRLAGHQQQRQLTMLIEHKESYTGYEDDQCACCT